jgi:hypothetical protein
LDLLFDFFHQLGRGTVAVAAAFKQGPDSHFQFVGIVTGQAMLHVLLKLALLFRGGISIQDFLEHFAASLFIGGVF